jgi:hypothetical protein
MKYCKKCGNTVNNYEVFCPRCGEKQTEASTDHYNAIKEKVLETPDTCVVRMKKTIKSKERLMSILAIAFVVLGFILALMTPGLKQTFKSNSLNSINPFILPGILFGGVIFVILLVYKNKMNKLIFAVQNQNLTITNMRVYGTSNNDAFNISLSDIVRAKSLTAPQLVSRDFECAFILSIVHSGGEVRLGCFDDAARIANVIERAKQNIS